MTKAYDEIIERRKKQIKLVEEEERLVNQRLFDLYMELQYFEEQKELSLQKRLFDDYPN